MPTDERPAWGQREVADTAYLVVPDARQSHPQYDALFRQKEEIIVGALWELCRIPPSFAEASTLLNGCGSGTAQRRLEGWRRMYWRDRHGWLQLIEGRLRDEANAVDAALL